ncbi:MAG: hypothetical protein HKN47_12435 [Pirellulaceae bacterium]|nr:hypothetical protein [Pirellulaceae bacterium]
MLSFYRIASAVSILMCVGCIPLRHPAFVQPQPLPDYQRSEVQSVARDSRKAAEPLTETSGHQPGSADAAGPQVDTTASPR